VVGGGDRVATDARLTLYVCDGDGKKGCGLAEIGRRDPDQEVTRDLEWIARQP
jgi:hypothetical protein